MKKYKIGEDYQAKIQAIQTVKNLLDQVNLYNDHRQTLLLEKHHQAKTIIDEAPNALEVISEEMSKQIDTSSISKLIYSPLEKIKLLPSATQNTFEEIIALSKEIAKTDKAILSFFTDKITVGKNGQFEVANLKFHAAEFASDYLTHPDDIAAFDYCYKLSEVLRKFQDKTPPTLYIKGVFHALSYIGYNPNNNEWSINAAAINNEKLMHV